ncbi:unnamed protein product [Auanema sp. JU1783]|nr:unnamed protein product [Auanema sp. JU1783]
MFGSSSSFNTSKTSLFGNTTNVTSNDDIEVPSAPDDTVQVVKFSPQTTEKPLLAAGSWDGVVRVWMVNDNGQCEPKAQQNIPAPVLDIDWTDDGTKIFIAAADKDVRLWDLASNQVAVVGSHDGPVRTCHWIKGNNYSCLMTGSWDKTLRFWDMRNLPTQSSLANIQLPERVYCADVVYPMAAVVLANKSIKVYNLENGPQEVKSIDITGMKYQYRCIAIFKDKNNSMPCGFAVGSIEGRVGVQFVEAANPRDNFTFKCHRSPELVNGFQEIYAVNDVAFHPQHGTLVTVGGDGRYSMWDKDARTKLKASDANAMPITSCHIHASGQIMAIAFGYDWSKGHEGNTQTGSKIVLHKCFEEMKPKPKKT